MAEQLTAGVWSFPQTMERDGVETTIHPAVVETAKGLLLLDVGYPGLTDQVEANLDDAGFDWADVRGVLITHQDGDHAGALAAVVDRTDATVYAHERCAPYVDGREHPLKGPDDQRYPPATVDVELVDAVTFNTTAGPMEVVYTPGHAPGHVSLYFPDEQLVIAADALTADADGLAGPSEEFTLEMDEALASAARLADRDVEHVLCFHGGLVAADGDRISAVVEAMR